MESVKWRHGCAHTQIHKSETVTRQSFAQNLKFDANNIFKAANFCRVQSLAESNILIRSITMRKEGKRGGERQRMRECYGGNERATDVQLLAISCETERYRLI